ncbi:MAG: hypothetical protein ABIL88_06675 [candidate division WOR-3 bacterium]
MTLYPFLSSGGYLGLGLSYGLFHIQPAYYFGDFSKDVPYFWSKWVKFDFYGLYINWSNELINLHLGRFIPLDTGSLLINSYSKGLDGLKLHYALDDKVKLIYGLFSGKNWISDSMYYFNPANKEIHPGDVVSRYILLKGLEYKNIAFYELVVWSSLGSFPDMAILNPLFPGYLYQWLKGREVNVIWLLENRVKNLRVQLLIDDIQYLPSWWDTVPHKFALRVSFNGRLFGDFLWVPAFVYANRKVWDALYESFIYGSDYAHANLGINYGIFTFGVGAFGRGRYNGVYREPNIGEYPKFSFLHDTVKVGYWFEGGIRLGRFTLTAGYGDKPNSIRIKRFFVWFYLPTL